MNHRQSQISVAQTAQLGAHVPLQDDADIFQLLKIPRTINKGLLSDIPHIAFGEGTQSFSTQSTLGSVTRLIADAPKHHQGLTRIQENSCNRE